jgi:hypothetical protein
MAPTISLGSSHNTVPSAGATDTALDWMGGWIGEPELLARAVRKAVP